MTRTPLYAAGFSLLLGWGSMAISAAAVPGVPARPQPSAPVAAPAPQREQTLLAFETTHYRVRVFQVAAQLFLSVYNKETGYTDLNQVPAQQVPPEGSEDPWQTYVNQRGDLHYFARVNPLGGTSLEIRVPGESPTQPEMGFNATYSFPHSYLGQSIDTALETLTKSGWVVEEQVKDAVALSANDQSLSLKFNPDTGEVTYTRLVP